MEIESSFEENLNSAAGWMWLPSGDTTHLRAITDQVISLLKRTDEKRNKWRETRKQEETEVVIK